MPRARRSEEEMKIRNYTSSVAVDKSLAEIEQLLVDIGANHFSKFYNEKKELAGVLFQMLIGGTMQTFQLPAKPKAVEKVMLSEVKRPRRGTRDKIQKQAARTAWKLLEEWVHIQVSMIQMEQAEAIQVFLPYVFDIESQQTYFDRLKENAFKQLQP
jgi:hypothetical protein